MAGTLQQVIKPETFKDYVNLLEVNCVAMNQPSCSHTANVEEYDSDDTLPLYKHSYHPHCNKPRRNINGAQCFELKSTDLYEPNHLVFRWRFDSVNVWEVVWSKHFPVQIAWGRLPPITSDSPYVSTSFLSIADVKALDENCARISKVVYGNLHSIKINNFILKHDRHSSGVVFINETCDFRRVLPRTGCIRLLKKLHTIFMCCHTGQQRMFKYLNEQANATSESEPESSTE